jgi:DedD protein
VLVLHPRHAAAAAEETVREVAREAPKVTAAAPIEPETPLEIIPRASSSVSSGTSAPVPSKAPMPAPATAAAAAAGSAVGGSGGAAETPAPLDETAVVRPGSREDPSARQETIGEGAADDERTAARRSRVPLFAAVGVVVIAAAIGIPRLLSPTRTSEESADLPAIDAAEAERTAEELLERMNAMGTPPPSEAPQESPPGGVSEPPGTAASTTPSTPTQQSAPPQTTTPAQQSPPAATTVEKPAATPAPPPAAPPPSVPRGSASGNLAVHVSSVHTSLKAEEETARLKAAGFDVFTRRVDLGPKGTWHRVYVGPFTNRADADAAAEAIRTRGVSDYAQVQRIAPEGGRTP